MRTRSKRRLRWVTTIAFAVSLSMQLVLMSTLVTFPIGGGGRVFAGAGQIGAGSDNELLVRRWRILNSYDAQSFLRMRWGWFSYGFASYRCTLVPFWPVVAAAGAVCLRASWPTRRAGKPCAFCGYDLTGIRGGEPCPECGASKEQ